MEKQGWLVRVVANAGGDMSQREGDGSVNIMWGLERKSLEPHTDAERARKLFGEPHNIDTVSYTHLTLPTICSV